MNIQIYGTKKSNDSKKAERFFKERGVKFQYVDLAQNRMSEGELKSILSSLKMSLDDLIDENNKLTEKTYYKYLADDYAKIDKVMDNQSMLIQPVVRNGRKATIGLNEAEWKKWIEEEKNDKR